jgi:hypothetical protein
MSEGTYDTESKNIEQQKAINNNHVSEPEEEIREVEILKDDILSGTFDENEISNLPDDVKTLVLKRISSSVSMTGPLPPPSILAGYEQVLPGAAERIVSMAEKEQDHRHSFDNKCQKTDSRDSLLGILCGFVLGVAALVAGVIVIMRVPNKVGAVTGSVLGISGIASIVATFISGTKATWKIKDK